MPILKILFFEYLSKMFLFHFSRHYSGWSWSGRSQSEPNLLKSLLFALKKLAAYTIENNLHNQLVIKGLAHDFLSELNRQGSWWRHFEWGTPAIWQPTPFFQMQNHGLKEKLRISAMFSFKVDTLYLLKKHIFNYKENNKYHFK